MLHLEDFWMVVGNSLLHNIVRDPCGFAYHLSKFYNFILLEIIRSPLLIWIWYNALHIYQSKSQLTRVDYNTSFTKIHKFGPTIVTWVLKTNLVIFWYLETTINTWHNLALGWWRGSIHTNHFQVAWTQSTLRDSVKTIKLDVCWITRLTLHGSVNTRFTLLTLFSW